MIVRTELTGDHEGVHAVNSAAFETATEADLVEALRSRASPVLSLAAVEFCPQRAESKCGR